MILTILQEDGPTPIKIDASGVIRALTFTVDGKYLVVGHDKEVGAWRVEDRKRVARMAMPNYVNSVAASKSGKWIVAGTSKELFVLDAQTYQLFFKHEEGNLVNAVHFSPDSTRLIAGTDNKTAIVWDFATGKQVLTLHHENAVNAAKYVPQGDRIATATRNLVQVWDSSNGRLLVKINVRAIPYYNTGLLWSNDHLFVVSDGKINQFDAYTGSKVSEWPVADTNGYSCIALPKHGELITYSTKRAITFWDTSTHNKLDLIQHHQDIRSIAHSPDDRFLAFGGADKKITIRSLPDITVSAEARRVYGVSDQRSLLSRTLVAP